MQTLDTNLWELCVEYLGALDAFDQSIDVVVEADYIMRRRTQWTQIWHHFQEMCRTKNWSALVWFLCRFKLNHAESLRALDIAVRMSSVAVVRFVDTLVPVDKLEMAEQRLLVRNIVRRGHLALLQWLIPKHHDCARELFILACGHDHIHVANWIAENFDIGSWGKDMSVFPHLCSVFSIDALKCIHAHFEIPIYRASGELFSACSCGHQDLAAWILEEFKVTEKDIQLGVERAVNFGKSAFISWMRGKCPDVFSDAFWNNAERQARLNNHRDFEFLYPQFQWLF